jgi:hypothetical protein
MFTPEEALLLSPTRESAAVLLRLSAFMPRAGKRSGEVIGRL